VIAPDLSEGRLPSTIRTGSSRALVEKVMERKKTIV